MWDIILEICRATVMGIFFGYLLLTGRKQGISQHEGWSYILAGFSLILFGMVIDITHNFPSLNKFIIIGDTKYEALLEKVVGYLFGFMFLAIGFIKWMPTIVALKETERMLERSSDQLKVLNEQLQKDIVDHERTEKALLNAAQQWRATFDGISDIVSLLDMEGRVLRCNKAMTRLVEKPFSEILNRPYWEIIHGKTAPIEECPVLRMKQTLSRETALVQMDGRWFNIAVDPVLDETGCLIGSVHIMSDISDRKQEEEAVQRSEEEARRLAQENAVMAEIGRIISSTLNIEEVYERFAEEVNELIPFDRIVINIVNIEKSTVSNVYMAGKGIADRKVGEIYPLEGSGNAEMVRTKSGLLIQTEDFNEYKDRFPMLLSTFQVGFRSIMNVPLSSKGRIIGGLLLRSFKPYAYTEKDVRLAERVGSQIAGAIANAQLFAERKRAEEALRESEDRYRDLVEHSQDLICTHNLEGQILSMNRAAEKLLGYERSELLKMNIRDILVPEIRDGLEGYLNEIKRHGVAKGLMFVQTKTGEKRILEYNNTLRTEGVSAPIVRSMTHDVTERVRVEKSVKQLSQENVIIAEIGRVISSTLEIEEVYEQFAKEVHKLILFDGIAINMINYEEGTVTVPFVSEIGIPGCQPGEVLPLAGSVTGKVMQTRPGFIIQTEDRDELKDQFPTLLTAFDKGLRSLMVVPLIYKDHVIGTLHFRSVKSKAYSEKDLQLAASIGNQVAGAIANAKLFNERKRAEEALRQSEEKYRTILENIQDGYLEVDLAGHFTFVNNAECRNLGYTSEELIGMNYRQYTDETTAIKLYQTFNGVYRTGESLKVLDLEVIRKDGTKAVNEISVSLIRDSEGKPIGFRGIARDVTERKRAEEERTTLQEQLRQSQKMEAIGQLAGGVAHDFNNLLTVIQGYSELILKGLNSDNRLCQDVREILNASERASSLTRQLLAFSRKQVLQPKVLDLNNLVANMEKMFQRLIGENIDLITLPTKNLERIKADPGQIEQAILNLVVNARDAMPSGGKLTIETSNVELDENYARSHVGVIPGRYVMLSVSDTGCGMPPEIRKKIFDPFFTTKEKGKGTGLGLSTVYGIVKQSEGSIWVYSEPGRGTTFKMYFPRIEEVAKSIEPGAAITKSVQGSETILLVEDEEMVRRLARTVLQNNGYNVLEASNGEEGLRIAQEHGAKQIHLMVTDVVMPGMSGRELADCLEPIRPEMKVLYMSGYTDDAIIRHGVLEQGMAFIQKPFAPDALLRKVRDVLDESQQEQQSFSETPKDGVMPGDELQTSGRHERNSGQKDRRLLS